MRSTSNTHIEQTATKGSDDARLTPSRVGGGGAFQVMRCALERPASPGGTLFGGSPLSSHLDLFRRERLLFGSLTALLPGFLQALLQGLKKVDDLRLGCLGGKLNLPAGDLFLDRIQNTLPK